VALPRRRFIEGYGETDSAAGNLLMAAGVAGFVSACFVAQGLVVGAALRAAAAASVQGVTAMLLLAWWVASDFWGDTAYADKSTLPLLAVLLLDAAVLVWAVRRLGAVPS
jgi:hypothetical protein